MALTESAPQQSVGEEIWMQCIHEHCGKCSQKPPRHNTGLEMKSSLLACRQALGIANL